MAIIDELDFRSLCISVGEIPPYNDELDFNLDEDLLKQCGEIRWHENNREINLRNYAERPEDYRDR